MRKQQTARRTNVEATVADIPITPEPVERRVPRAETLIGLMRGEGGATAAELGAAVGWQVHSVRGFIAGTLKKRSDLAVTATREGGATRYRVIDTAEKV